MAIILARLFFEDGKSNLNNRFLSENSVPRKIIGIDLLGIEFGLIFDDMSENNDIRLEYFSSPRINATS